MSDFEQPSRGGPELIADRMRFLTGVAVAVLVVVYLLTTLTGIGQAIDDQALIGRKIATPEEIETTSRLLHLVNTGSLLGMLIVLLVIGWVRSRLVLATITAVSFGLAIVGAEFLKAVIPRPDLAPEYVGLLHGGRTFDTYPSGHSTIATGFALAVVLISAPRWRFGVGLVGALWASLIAGGVVLGGWHRPSDAIGGTALAASCLGLVAWLNARRLVEPIPVQPFRRPLLCFAAVFALMSVGLGVLILFGAFFSQGWDLPAEVTWWLFPASVLVVVAFSTTMVGWFTSNLIRSPSAGNTMAGAAEID